MRWYQINGIWKDERFNVEMKTAPIQTHSEKSVPWDVSAEAWKEYAAQGHGDQSHERLCERGGFGAAELAIFLYERIKRIEDAFEGVRIGRENARSNLYRVLAAAFPDKPGEKL